MGRLRALSRSFLGLACLIVSRVPAHAGNVLVVGGGGAYTQIQPAVDAAADGDVILVRGGSYQAFAVANKSLSIVGDGGAPHLDGSVRVINLTTAKTVVIENFEVFGVPGAGNARALYLSNNSGSVRLEACKFYGASGTVANHPDGWDGAYVDHCADVSIARCTFAGGMGLAGDVYASPPYDTGDAGIGLRVDSSSIATYETTVRGGPGEDASWFRDTLDGGNGSDACRLGASTLLASNCTFIGGHGGWACYTCDCMSFYWGGSAGYALNLQSGGSLARIQGGTESGGIPGRDISNCSVFLHPPLPARSGEVFVDLASPPRSFSAPSPVRESTAPLMSFQGQPGELALLFVSGTTQNVYRPAWEGQLLVCPRPPHLAMIVGTTDSNGQLIAPLPLGDLGPGLQAVTLHMQSLFIDTQGAKRLGAPSTMVVLDSAF